MKFIEKYTTQELNETKKTVISVEAYAIGPLLEQIARELEKLRLVK